MNTVRRLRLLAALPLIISSVWLLTPDLCAQDAAPIPQGRSASGWLLGGGVGGALQSHTGTVAISDGRNAACCRFSSGDGAGLVFGARLWRFLADDIAAIARVSYEQWNGSFDGTITYPAFASDGDATELRLDQTLTSTLGIVSIDLFGAYDFGWNGLYAGAGPSIAILLSQSHRFESRIIDPPGVTFLNGAREQILFDDNRSLAKGPAISLRAAAGIRMPLGALQLDIQALYALPLTSIGNAMTWKVAGLQIEAGVLVPF